VPAAKLAVPTVRLVALVTRLTEPVLTATSAVVSVRPAGSVSARLIAAAAFGPALPNVIT
jgi:hypothetical protein